MKTIKKQPKIRFKGYTDEWQQRKLGELAESFEYGLNAPSKEYDGENKYLRITDIDESSRQFKTESLTSPNIDLELADNYILKKGDILFARTGASVGKTYRYNERDGVVYYAGFLIRARIKADVNAEFIFQNTLTENYNNYIKVTSQRSGQPGVNAFEYSKFELMIPKQKEQQKIGSFFKQLDDTIDLHQRKLEALEKTKKSFLQKMFPKKDETKPEIRFAGFTDDWEQRKLIEVSEMYNNLRIPVTASDRITGNTPYYGANGIQDYVDGFTHSGEYVLLAEDGANDLLNYPVHYVNGTVWVNNHAHVISGKSGQLYNLFLVSRMKSMNIIPWLVGGGRAKLNGEVLKKIPILLPSYPEQQKIGTFFKQLDDTIALHQRQLEVLKNMKTSFLQKMYI